MSNYGVVAAFNPNQRPSAKICPFHRLRGGTYICKLPLCSFVSFVVDLFNLCPSA